MNADFRLTGRHVFAITLGFFLAVIAANAIFITLAVRSFPGENERKSYLQGLRYNDVLAGRAAQDALGWRAAIDRIERTEGVVGITISLSGDGGAALDALRVTGAIVRPASDAGERALAFEPRGDGRYVAFVDARAGAWELSVRAERRAGERFEFSNRVIFP